MDAECILFEEFLAGQILKRVWILLAEESKANCSIRPPRYQRKLFLR